MATNFKFTIITPERVVYEDEINEATVPTMDGQITVLARHTPLVSVLATGEIRVKKLDYEVFFAVSKGVIEVRPNNQVIILTNFAEQADEIDEAKAEIGRQRAEAMLQEKDNLTYEDLTHLEAVLERELARIKIANRRKKS